MADYPSEYELDVALRDGGGARIRPIKPGDGHLLVEFFERLGPESRYFRFFRIKETLEPKEVEYFTNVDYSDRMALIAVLDGRMIGLASYDREPDKNGTAEVAFAVADEHQGRGIGTQLLQLLTNYARSHGVQHFEAFVLPENRQMMRLFRNSGYELTRTIDEGVFTVDFPVAESEGMLHAEWEREKRAVAASILPLFFPRSVAVIGASTDAASIGGTPLPKHPVNGGFTGPLYPVNPKAKVISSVRAYPTIGEVPDEVDLAYIVVPQAYVIDVARQCAEAGVRGIVVISAGFSETGDDGAKLEAELLEIVRDSGMRMVGPNCMGLLNTAPSVQLNGTFAPVYPPAGNVAMSSQSGALGIAILDYATRNNIGISQFVSVGNKADVSGNDLILAWEDDPQTDVITLYLESFGNPRKFSRIARRIGRRKPIIAVKSGRSRVREPGRLVPYGGPRIVGCGRAGPVSPGRGDSGRHHRGAVRRRQPPRPTADPCGWSGRDRHQRRRAGDPRCGRARVERADAPRAFRRASGANRLQAPGRGLDQESGRSDRVGRAE